MHSLLQDAASSTHLPHNMEKLSDLSQPSNTPRVTFELPIRPLRKDRQNFEEDNIVDNSNTRHGRQFIAIDPHIQELKFKFKFFGEHCDRTLTGEFVKLYLVSNPSFFSGSGKITYETKRSVGVAARNDGGIAVIESSMSHLDSLGLQLYDDAQRETGIYCVEPKKSSSEK